MYYYLSKLPHSRIFILKKMNFTLTTEFKEGYLQINSVGIIETMEDLRAHSKMIFEEIEKHTFHKILINEPGMKLPLDIVPYFNLVKDYVDSYPPEIHDFKIAVVVSREFKEVVCTWETLCQSRGLSFFGFISFQEAVDCLINEDDE